MVIVELSEIMVLPDATFHSSLPGFAIPWTPMQNKRWFGTSSKTLHCPQYPRNQNIRTREGICVIFAVQQDPLDEPHGLGNVEGKDDVTSRKFRHKFDPESELVRYT